ncbi:thioredoxin-disulfide reductase [Desulfomonile tiedjei]|uniref:Thioredoxin reductase n=1 Tax=Desulfomonile tiedjei (strain ATCC 49306 / DSM 6799 / DCB-1) TaxID=706587 RepID=I4CBS5_DESTA|nr:thioredoxin-disulfide reductase [Desulfomonile tiedjei]AFM27016.1 thioredoxin-disulfide reductase [Desulfomonile tiedjei DSM 6799]
MSLHDVIIVGAGPAGLTAAIYAGRSKLKTLLVEKLAVGGQAATTDEIENYPGFATGISGSALSEAMAKQASRFGVEKVATKAQGLFSNETLWVLRTEKCEYAAHAVIIASGAYPKALQCPGELEFRGRGVSYCATCDAAFYEGASLLVVGGGDAAVEEAVYLTKFADKVTLVHRRDSLRATGIVQERALANPKLQIMWNTVVEEIRGSSAVETTLLRNVVSGETQVVPVDGVFIYVGLTPNSEWLGGTVETDVEGYIPTDEHMCTNMKGVYAVGDVRRKLLRQVVTAAADGAIAAFHAEKYIEAGLWQV